MRQSLMKYLSFGTLSLLVVILIIATVIEKMLGATFVSQYIYGNPLIISLWGVMGLSSLVYLVKCHVYKKIYTFLLHLSFCVILVGALITYISGKQGTVHLRCGAAPVDEYENPDGLTEKFPFCVELKEFNQKYYQGTFAPMDYESKIVIIDPNNEHIEGSVSMNNIYSYKGYRFYQSGYDRDNKGTILSVSYDPGGITVTYIGYVMLLVSMIGFFFQNGSCFRRLLSHPILKKGVLAIVFMLYPFTNVMADKLMVLPSDVADEFGNILVYYNDRVCPMSTMAKDFTIKLCGKSSYKGFSSNQVLTGWFFYYDDWKEEPVIKIKGGEVSEILGVSSERASLVDFIDLTGYKLEGALHEVNNISLRRNIESANEKFNLISMVATGTMLKIYPYRSDSTETAVWYSLTDRLPMEMPNDQWAFVHNSMSFVAEKVAMQDFEGAKNLLRKIRKYQKNAAGVDGVPTETRLMAEKLYNKISGSFGLAIVCLLIGIISYCFNCRQLSLNKKISPVIVKLQLTFISAIFLWLSLLIVLRGYISNYIPLSNGFETMQFMAWCCVLIAVLSSRRFVMALPFGFLLSGLALMVSMMGERNPAITQLMPVLQSPLLSIHVVVIMIAYSLLAFVMLNGVTAIVFNAMRKDESQAIEYLQVVSGVMVYPAVFLLTVGIFIGAVWANVSWGRYWGWDPKEVWALITMIVYALLLHTTSFQRLKNPMLFHWFCVIAFLSVLITYFGVNFFLGGLHSYA